MMEHFYNLKAEICRKFSKWYLKLQIIMRYWIQNITIVIMNRALLDKTQIYMECRAQELPKDYRECFSSALECRA